LFLLFTTLLAATACDLVPATQQLSSLTPTKQIITDSPTPTLYLTNIPDSNGPRGPNGPSGVPVVPNASLIKAKIVSISKTPENITLGLLVLESKPISGYPDFGANVVNSEINAIWQDAGEIPLSVDQIIMGELSYQGDEREGFYLLRNIIKP
jgi:hypothetical protein